ncbi:N-6 DNA methylase [Chloroflexota bacterium]
MQNDAKSIVKKLWGYCNILRDDGVSYSDYVEQLTYLLFLKMAEGSAAGQTALIPNHLSWSSLISKDINALEAHYNLILKTLGAESGMLGRIFNRAQNKINDAAKLHRLIVLIDSENWNGFNLDVKGEIYEGLLQKNAEDVKSGAGQYFTPRPLISAIIEVMNPQASMTICDPACGTGGFLLAAHDYIRNIYSLSDEQADFLSRKALKGTDIVENVTRLCAMNLYLHDIRNEDAIDTSDSLTAKPQRRYDMVLTNPPFGKKSSVTITKNGGKRGSERLAYERDDFWATTSNKQLNFLQHTRTLLKPDGSAAIVVPDNVLFEKGAGETIRRRLLDECDVHTMLRLPTGLFYAQGVNANVLFFDNKAAGKGPQTGALWIYDLRTDMHFTLKNKPLKHGDLAGFIKCYNQENRQRRKESERFKPFCYDELTTREEANLDITWLKSEKMRAQDSLADPETIVESIKTNLTQAFEALDNISHNLKGG